MNPLSPFTYYRRHKRQTLLLLGLVSLMTLGVCVMVRLLDSIIEQHEIAERYLTRFSMVSSLDAEIVSQVRVHPDVAWAIPAKNLYVNVPMNFTGGFRLFGVLEQDVQTLMYACNLRLKQGRLLRPRANEIILSEEIADVLGLRIGDQVSRAIDEHYYEAIPTTMTLVGILESTPSTDPKSDIRVGFVSYEYLDSHELYSHLSSGLVVIPRQGYKAAADEFLEAESASSRTDVRTYRLVSEEVADGRLFVHLIFGIVDGLAAVAIALVVGTIHQIALTRRMPEFGLLYAVGYNKNRLIRRLTLEATVVALAGWVAGLVLSWALFSWLDANVLPATMELGLVDFAPVWLSALIPLAVIAFVTFGIIRAFARFDAIAIVERGKLSMEEGSKKQKTKRSSIQPLSSWLFYLRHRRRGAVTIISMVLAILGIAFPAFLLLPAANTMEHAIEYLNYVGEVSPRRFSVAPRIRLSEVDDTWREVTSDVGLAVDPGVAAQIRNHSAVEHVIPTIRLGLRVEAPPATRICRVYGISEEELAVLFDLFGIHLKEGRLPRARSNEIVLSEAVAMNRGLRVGDAIGRPAYEKTKDERIPAEIPTEMVLVGLFSPNDVWIGFASYEYLASHEAYASWPVSQLVVPVEGYKGELDGWLEENVASTQTAVSTYEKELHAHRQVSLVFLLTFAAVESVVVIVAAFALSVLSTIFFTQRKEEFGILHAIGHSRPWLILRTVREIGSVVAVAWLIGAAVCIAGLVGAQAVIYAPRGLSLDFLNLVPWLFTLPIPLAVVAASAGTIAWMLSRLDPVAIIERR
jgi:ABC-type antimicrobial peptide transport system permease subunit